MSRSSELSMLVSIACHTALGHGDVDSGVTSIEPEMTRMASEIEGKLATADQQIADLARRLRTAENHLDRQARRLVQVQSESALEAVAQTGDLEVIGFFVYLLYERGTVIYVGRSENILARLGTHMSSPDRRHRVDRVRLVRCASYSAMCVTEDRLIASLSPELNTIGIAS